MMETKSCFEQYTAAGFTALIQELIDGYGNPAYQDRLLEHFIKITEHPEGSDLIYRGGLPDGPHASQILDRVRDWRSSQGLSDLKPDTTP